MQSWLQNIVSLGYLDTNFIEKNFMYYGATLEDNVLPSISTFEDQQYFECLFVQAQLIMIDTYLTLASTIIDNNDKDLLLNLREQGKTVIFLQHTEKGI